MSNMPAYDPNESRKLADQLLRSAKSVMIFDPCYGALFGAALVVAAGRTNLLLIGLWAVSGALMGLFISFQRARAFRDQAQTLLCQMEIEENTRKGNRAATTTCSNRSPGNSQRTDVPAPS